MQKREGQRELPGNLVLCGDSSGDAPAVPVGEEGIQLADRLRGGTVPQRQSAQECEERREAIVALLGEGGMDPVPETESFTPPGTFSSVRRTPILSASGEPMDST
jgi:hypothetical protein